MYECDSTMSQHGHCLNHQQKAVNGQEEDLECSWVNVVLLELLKGEVAQKNQPGDVDEEEDEECGVTKAQQRHVDVIDISELGRHWLEFEVNEDIPELHFILL